MSEPLREAIAASRAKYGGVAVWDGVNSLHSRHHNDGSDECVACMTLHPCDAAILLEIIDAALRSTPAAPTFGGSLASVQPTPAAPQPECRLLLADGTICVKRAGHSDDHGMALRSTPAAQTLDRVKLARAVGAAADLMAVIEDGAIDGYYGDWADLIADAYEAAGYPGWCGEPRPHSPHQRSDEEACPGVPETPTKDASHD